MTINNLTKTLFGVMVALLGYFGARTMNTLDQINNNLTTIVVQQSTMQQDILLLKGAKESNDKKWEEHDKSAQDFWRTYDVPLRKNH